MPPKILAPLGGKGDENGNGNIDYSIFPQLIGETLIEKPKAKILAGLSDFKAKILAGKTFVQIPKGDIPEFDNLSENVKAKILAKILAGPPVFVEIAKGEILEYDPLSVDTKAKILAKILAFVTGEPNNIVESNLPDLYEENIRGPLKIENERLRRMVGELYVENCKLKKAFGLSKFPTTY